MGFRPFLFRVAEALELTGFVRNVGWGVVAEFQGAAASMEQLVGRIRGQLPPQARLDELQACRIDIVTDEVGFEIRESSIDPLDTVIPHDMAICKNCLLEFQDTAERHGGNYFVSCTDCGPRFTIIEALPYDRERTLMRRFPFCPKCRQEYENPADRRFNAQTTTCPVCGPHYRVLFPAGAVETADSDQEIIRQAAKRIQQGEVVALKGIGGYHLLCDPDNTETLRRLTGNKRREGKPMALVACHIDDVRSICNVRPQEQTLFESERSPIVLFHLKGPAYAAVNDGLSVIGIMRAYTAALYDLVRESGKPFLVATSANLSGIPTVIDDVEAFEKLPAVADFIIGHDRPIRCRCDDSVMLWEEEPITIRAGRGTAPLTYFRRGVDGILALGAQEKASFAFGVRDKVVLSPYLGDQDTMEYQQFFRETLDHFLQLYGFRPTRIICDLHPAYATTRLAEELGSRWGIEPERVQHHQAHIQGVLLEHDVQEAIGFAFDGTGLGDDGAIWGSEAFVAEHGSMRRAFQLQYYPLSGGEAAIREPGRLLLPFLHRLDATAAQRLETAEPKLALAAKAAAKMDWPQTSSMGRLFDIVGALLGCGLTARYEAILPMRLEAMADAAVTDAYGMELTEKDGLTVSPVALLAPVVEDVGRGTPAPVVAARFHNTVCQLIVDVAERLRAETGLQNVALAGGVFQNRLLLGRTKQALSQRNFQVIHPRFVPINDGGISFGQVRAAYMQSGKGK